MKTELPPLVPGTLYLVATPIGNLEDITLRALRTLKECDRIAAEDTRRTGQLLKYFEISRPLLSYHKFNEAKRSEQILERLKAGEMIALVSDAGSPGISDPGQRVVAAAVAASEGGRCFTKYKECPLSAYAAAAAAVTAPLGTPGNERRSATAACTCGGTRPQRRRSRRPAAASSIP